MSVIANVEDLEKVFHSSPSGFRRPVRVTALDRVTLNIHEGEILAIAGANGAGKTTLLKILATLLVPSSGRVEIGGVSAVRFPRKVRPMIAYSAGEESGFYPRLSGRDNLLFFGALYGLKDAPSRVEALRDILSIADFDRPYQECSTGTKQRMSLAKCLLTDAKLYVLDEPTRGLDPEAADVFRDLLRRKYLSRGGTVVMATHDLAHLKGFAGRLAVLTRGRLAAFGTAEELRQKFSPGNESWETLYRHILQKASHGNP